MSKGLGKIERAILDACIWCLGIKERMMKDDKDISSCYHYPGGCRDRYDMDGKRYYYRNIGRGNRRINDMPEDIIDLREVSYIVRQGTGRGLQYYAGAVYGQALKSLIRKGYFLDPKSGEPITEKRVMVMYSGEMRTKCLRFVKMDMDKLKHYGCKDNT